MTLNQAKIVAIEQGKKIRHKYSLPEEWIMYLDGVWISEDGYEIGESYWKTAEQEDWEVVESNS